MPEPKSIEKQELRKFVSKLYIGVLTEKISVREALMRFPKDCDDGSIIAAWHALCHLEADEDLRKRDAMYAKEQDEYIEYIAFTLNKGQSLPENVIKSYDLYHNSALTPSNGGLKGIIYHLKKFICT